MPVRGCLPGAAEVRTPREVGWAEIASGTWSFCCGISSAATVCAKGNAGLRVVAGGEDSRKRMECPVNIRDQDSRRMVVHHIREVRQDYVDVRGPAAHGTPVGMEMVSVFHVKPPQVVG
jgi:hypothetical protein